MPHINGRRDSTVMDDEDEILAAELGKVGAKAGAVGAAIAGQLGVPGTSGGSSRGGAWGAAFAGRRLRKNVRETEITLAAPPDEVFVQVVSLIGAMGRVLAQAGPADGRSVVRGIVGAGAMNLNPAVVTVTMVPAGDSGTSVHLRGVAKEGLIKQRAGQKAVERLATRLM
jgi:hypothetical protein